MQIRQAINNRPYICQSFKEEEKMSFVVAIDGPAGTGKGTVTKIIAKDLGLINIDTGAMYRCVTLEALRKNLQPATSEELAEILEKIDIVLKKKEDVQEVWLNGEDVSTQIRTPKIDEMVGKFSALKMVRDKMTPLQRKMGQNGNIIMEGRDIGTTVFPDADIKIYLDCSVEERARRRYKQNLEKGIEISYEEVLESIRQRHKLETEREIAPLRQADDAILVDSTNLTIEEVVEKIENIIKEKMC